MGKTELINASQALPGRDTALDISGTHAVNGSNMLPPYDANYEIAHFALGCFWGAERLFWQLEGVVSTAVGYGGGFTPNPTYEEVCSGDTAHAEVVLVVFDPAKISYQQLVTAFFEHHDPTQGMRQGGDIGTQYRSALYVHNEQQQAVAETALANYQQALSEQGVESAITTEVTAFSNFYFAEEYHQQYLYKNPQGYCGLGGLGVCMPPSLQG